MSKEYVYPPEIDKDRLIACGNSTLRSNGESAEPIEEANHRRAALIARGCSTYIVGKRKGYPSILCLCCGLGSANLNDIQQKYCGFCHTFHEEFSTPI